jgi:hypothetical protein
VARHFQIHNGSLVREQQIHRGNDEGKQFFHFCSAAFKDYGKLRKICFIILGR